MEVDFEKEELYQRCIDLEFERYALLDKIDNIQEYLVNTHITLEEIEKAEEIINE